jgi:hypothetical protein
MHVLQGKGTGVIDGTELLEFVGAASRMRSLPNGGGPERPRKGKLSFGEVPLGCCLGPPRAAWPATCNQRALCANSPCSPFRCNPQCTVSGTLPTVSLPSSAAFCTDCIGKPPAATPATTDRTCARPFPHGMGAHYERMFMCCPGERRWVDGGGGLTTGGGGIRVEHVQGPAGPGRSRIACVCSFSVPWGCPCPPSLRTSVAHCDVPRFFILTCMPSRSRHG